MDATERNATISARIMAAKIETGDIRAAIDQVLGAGTSARLIGEIYDALRAQNAAHVVS